LLAPARLLLVAGLFQCLAAAAQADEIDQVIDEIIALSGAADMVRSTMDELIPQMQQQVRQAVLEHRPGTPEPQLARINDAVVAEMRAIMSEQYEAMLPELRRFYRENFAPDELDRLVELIREPVVQKQATLIPRFFAELNPRMMEWGLDAQRRIGRILERELQ
jgi:hypothetical protein